MLLKSSNIIFPNYLQQISIRKQKMKRLESQHREEEKRLKEMILRKQSESITGFGLCKPQASKRFWVLQCWWHLSCKISPTQCVLQDLIRLDTETQLSSFPGQLSFLGNLRL